MMREHPFFLATVMIVSTIPIHAQTGALANQIDYLVQAIKAHNIERVEIIGVPLDALFRTNMSPDRLESLWDYQVVLRDVSSHLELDAKELTLILTTAGIQPSPIKFESLDVRSAFIFFGKSPGGKRVASIYLDRNGRLGAFNDVSVSFSSEFLLRLKKALRAPLKKSMIYSLNLDLGVAGESKAK